MCFYDDRHRLQTNDSSNVAPLFFPTRPDCILFNKQRVQPTNGPKLQKASHQLLSFCLGNRTSILQLLNLPRPRFWELKLYRCFTSAWWLNLYFGANKLLAQIVLNMLLAFRWFQTWIRLLTKPLKDLETWHSTEYSRITTFQNLFSPFQMVSQSKLGKLISSLILPVTFLTQRRRSTELKWSSAVLKK